MNNPNNQGNFNPSNQSNNQDQRQFGNQGNAANQANNFQAGGYNQYGNQQAAPQGPQGAQFNQGQPQFNQGQVNRGQMNQGQMNQGQMNQGQMNQKPANQGNNSFGDMMKDVTSWFKSFFSAKPSSAVELAGRSNNPLSWTLVLGLMGILGAFTHFFNSLMNHKAGAGYIIGKFFIGILLGAFVYGIILGVVFMSKAINKKVNKWYEPFNQAAALAIPAIIAITLGALFGSFYNVFTIWFNSTIQTVTIVLTVIMFLEMLKKDTEGAKPKEWMNILYVLLLVTLTQSLYSFAVIRPIVFSGFLDSLSEFSNIFS